MVHNTRMGVVMNQIFADISSFESLAGGSAGSSLSAFSDRQDVVVQNVDVGLATLSAIANDDELSRLVNFLKDKDRLEYADAALRGHSMGSIADLKRVLIHGIGARSMEDFDNMAGTDASKEKKSDKQTRTKVNAPKTYEKLGWWRTRRRLSKLVDRGREITEELRRFDKAFKKKGGSLQKFQDIGTPEEIAEITKLLAEQRENAAEWVARKNKKV